MRKCLERRRRGPRRRTAVALALLVLSSTAPAVPHAFWPTYYSAKSTLSIGEKGLQALVVVEVPTFELVAGFREHFSEMDLMAEIEAGRFAPLEDEYRDVLFDRFSEGLALEVDGRSVEGRWAPVDTPANGRGTEGFFVYLLEFVWSGAAPGEGNRELLGASRLEVRLWSRVLEDEDVMLANAADAGPGWSVVESSIPPPEEIPELPEGAELYEDLGDWSDDPVKRDLRIVFEREN